jgi:transcriptional regulator GlxA family with amidase domain
MDTIIVSGGEIVRSAAAAEKIVRWLKRAKARRIASVRSGAFLLAEAGRPNGRRATTHWDSPDHFRGRYPQVTLDPDRIFVRDREIWTSAGITAGIDLALALVEDDLGTDVARHTAQQLVVHQVGLAGRPRSRASWSRAAEPAASRS